jgi:hypothetical protein
MFELETFIRKLQLRAALQTVNVAQNLLKRQSDNGSPD